MAWINETSTLQSETIGGVKSYRFNLGAAGFWNVTAEVAAAVLAETNARIADVNAEEARAIAAETALQTAINNNAIFFKWLTPVNGSATIVDTDPGIPFPKTVSIGGQEYAVTQNAPSESPKNVQYDMSTKTYTFPRTLFTGEDVGVNYSFSGNPAIIPATVIGRPEFNEVIGISDIVSKNVDYSSYTLSAPRISGFANSDYTLDVPSLLSSMTIKTVATNTVITPIEIKVVSGVVSIVYTYASFITSSLEHTEIITDTHVIAQGNIIGFKSNSNVYYILQSNYGYQVGNSGFVGAKSSYGVTLNKTVSAGIYGRLNTLELSSLDFKSKIGFSLKSYPVNFDLYNQTSTSSLYLTNISARTTESETLKSIRTKCGIGVTVTVGIFNLKTLDNGTLQSNILHTYDPFVTTKAINTKAIEDNFIIPIGSYIGVRFSGSFNFTPTTGGGYFFANTSIGIATVANFTFAFDFITEVQTIGGILNRIGNLEALNAIEESTFPTLPKSILFSSSFGSLNDFTVNNWSVVSGGVSPLDIGVSNSVYLNKKYHIAQRLVEMNVKLNSDSVFFLDFAPYSTFVNVNGSGAVALDIPNNKISIYSRNVAGSGTLNEIASKNISFTFNPANILNLQITRDQWNTTIRLTDFTTGLNTIFSYEIITNSMNIEFRQNETIKFYLTSGTTSGVIVSNLTISSPTVTYMLFGDSNSEGFLASNNTLNDIYSIKLRKKLNGLLAISARAGENLAGTLVKVTSELSLIKPKYAVVTIGTNNGGSISEFINLITTIQSYGVIPVINHIPMNSAGTAITVNNNIDSAVRACPGSIIGMRLDIATAINGIPANGLNTAMSSDGTHFNSSGHQAMYNRAIIDIPFIFNS